MWLLHREAQRSSDLHSKLGAVEPPHITAYRVAIAGAECNSNPTADTVADEPPNVSAIALAFSTADFSADASADSDSDTNTNVCVVYVGIGGSLCSVRERTWGNLHELGC